MCAPPPFPLAAVCGGFIFFILYLPFTQLIQRMKTNELWHYNVAVSLWPTKYVSDMLKVYFEILFELVFGQL